MANLFFDIKKLKYLGRGAIIGRAVRIRRPEKVVIGDYSIIDDFTYISSDLETGMYCHIASNCNITGGGGKVKFGDFVALSAGCSIFSASSDYITASLELPTIPHEFRFGGTIEDVELEDHVLLGAHSIVLPGVHLPEGFATAAQTIVRKRVGSYEPWTLYGGSNCSQVIKRKQGKALKRAQELLGSRRKL